MAISNTKLVTTTGQTYDSASYLSQNWVETTAAGANLFAIQDVTLGASIKLNGISGDTVYIESSFADFEWKQNGKTVTADNGHQKITITLNSMTNKVLVSATLVFLDGEITLGNTKGNTKVKMSGLDDNGNAKTQALTTTLKPVTINAIDSDLAAVYFAGQQEPQDLTLTTTIDTLNASAITGANTVINGIQDAVGGSSTWNNGDSILGNGVTTVNLIENMGGVTGGNVASVTNVAAININLLDDSNLNEGQFTTVAAVNISNGVSGQTLAITNGALATTHSISNSNAFTETLSFASATGTSDTAKLAVVGAGTATTDAVFTVVGNDIETVSLATTGANFVTINGGSSAATFNITGAGTNEITIGSAATTMTVDASTATGANTINVGTLLGTSDVIKGSTSSSDRLIADLASAGVIIPTVTNIETLDLTFSVAGTLNASAITGATAVVLRPTSLDATITNLNASVVSVALGYDSAITTTAATTIGYAASSNSAVHLDIGATSTSANPAVSIGALTLTGNAGALTIESHGDAANDINNITVNSVSALTVKGSEQTLTALDVSATSAATVTIDGSLKSTAIGDLTVDESLATLNVTAGAGAATVENVNEDATTNGAINTTFNITGGAASQRASVGDINVYGSNTAAKTVTTVTNVTGGIGGATVTGLGVYGGSGAGNTVSSTLNVTGGVGTVNLGWVDVYAGNGAGNNLNAAVNITGGAGAITTGYIDFVGSTVATSSATMAVTLTATDALVWVNDYIGLESGNSGTSASTITLNANGGSILVDRLYVYDTDTTAISGSVTSGDTITITDLTGSARGVISTISFSGAGAVSIGAGISIWNGASDTVVDTHLLTGAFTLNLGAGTGNMNVTLGSGTNIVTTGTGLDNIIGGSGADTINSGIGNDTIIGNNGANFMTGAAGADVMSGGTGVDTYNYTSLATVAAQTGLTLATADSIGNFTSGSDFIKTGVAGDGTTYFEAAAVADYATALATASAYMISHAAVDYYLTSITGGVGLLFVDSTGIDDAEAVISLTGITSANFAATDII